MAPLARPRRFRQLSLHACRVAIFAAILLLIHFQASRRAAHRASEDQPPLKLAQVQEFFPQATSIGEEVIERGLGVFDSDGQLLGHCRQTSPEGDRFVGFSGPTDVMIASGADDRIVGLAVLGSGDTKEHIRQVVEDGSFLDSFNGLTSREAAGLVKVDAVAGATLTSRAIHEAVVHRLGGGRQSLRFPDEPSLAEVQSLFPEARFVEQTTETSQRWEVLGPGRRNLGYVLRSSPVADNLVGYQGPTESLIGFSPDDRVVGVVLRESFDNEPYVSYVREDSFFFKSFQGLSLGELAELDLLQAEVEGVSGATMTSMAVARGMVLAAEESRRPMQEPADPWQLRWSLRDLGTAAVILVGCLVGFSSLRSVRLLRFGFLLLLVVYLGLINGDMVSMAMISGWAQHGVPWRTAGSLVLLTFSAFLMPLTTRRNIYCSHLCPHGAAQQLLKNRLGLRLRIPSRIARWLRVLPAVLLGWCVWAVMWPLPVSLVDLEPFDAWVFRVAGWATITVAIVGLVASLFVPMGYCRFGCPTGLLLRFLRFNSRSDCLSPRDWAAVSMLLLAFFMAYLK